MIELSKPDHECVTSKCWCLFYVRNAHATPIIAASPTIEAARAAERLLLESSK